MIVEKDAARDGVFVFQKGVRRKMKNQVKPKPLTTPLSERQKRFVDFFIETGNETEAARRAGYSAKTARQIGSENLTKLDIHIKARLSEKEKSRIASQDEVLETLTRVLRREEKETVVMMRKRTMRTTVKGQSKTVTIEEPVLVEIPTKICDLNKAAELLGKRYGLYTDKIDLAGPIVLQHCVPRPENGDGSTDTV